MNPHAVLAGYGLIIVCGALAICALVLIVSYKRRR